MLVAGATSSRVGPALAILAGAFQFADELLPDAWWERLADSAPAPSVSLVVGLVLAATLAAWILATVSTILTFGDFELRREGDRLLISHGLLERRRSTIPISRIQAVTISEGWLRQPFGLAAVRVESAGYGKPAPSPVSSPIIRIADLPALLARSCPAYALDQMPPPLQPLPRRAERRYILANVWTVVAIVVLATAFTIAFPWSNWWWGLGAFGLLPPAAAYGLLQVRDTGWNIVETDRFVMRLRGVDRVTAITPGSACKSARSASTRSSAGPISPVSRPRLPPAAPAAASPWFTWTSRRRSISWSAWGHADPQHGPTSHPRHLDKRRR